MCTRENINDCYCPRVMTEYIYIKIFIKVDIRNIVRYLGTKLIKYIREMHINIKYNKDMLIFRGMRIVL